MAQAVLELIAKTDGWTGGIKRAQTGLTNFIKTHGGLHNALAQENQTMAQAIRKFGDFESKAATVTGRLRETEAAFMEWGMTYKEMTAAERATPAGKATLEQLNKLAPRIREMKTQMQELQGQIKIGGGVGFGKQFMQSLIPGLGMGVGAAGAMLAVRATTAAIGALKDAVVSTVNVNMDFEQSNANLAAILGKTRSEISALTENAKQLGGTTKFTASEVTELQTVLARRGLRANQIIDMTKGITNLAVATGTDLAQSAELAASTMQAFGMKASEMDRIVSVLGVSTTKSALTTEALGTSLQYVAPAARAADFSLEETVAILGTLVDNGINASTAGTSLRQILLSMSTSSGKLAKALGGPVKSFDELVAALQRIKNDGANSLESISKAVRVTALPAFLALVNNSERLDELRLSITGVEEEIQKMADEQLNTARGAQVIFRSAVEGLKLAFDESNGVMRDYYVILTKIVDRWRELIALRTGGQAAISFEERNITAEDRRQRAQAWIANWYGDNAQAANGVINSSFGTMGVAALNSYTGFVNNGSPVTLEQMMASGMPNLPLMSPEYSSDNAAQAHEYATPFIEAARKLQELNEEYKRLEPLDREYSQHRTATIRTVSHNGVIRGEDTYYQGIYDRVKEAMGGNGMTYDQFHEYVKNLHLQIGDMQEVLKIGEDMRHRNTLDVDVPDDENNLNNALADLKKSLVKTPAEQAAEIVQNALERYAEELAELKVDLEHGLINQAEFDNRKYNLGKTVFEAYGRANHKSPEQQYADGMAEWFGKMQNEAGVAAMSGGFQKLVDAENKYQQVLTLNAISEESGMQTKLESDKKVVSALETLWRVYAEVYADTQDAGVGEEMKYLAGRIHTLGESIEEQTILLAADKMVLSGVNSAVGRKAWNRISESDGGALYGKYNQFKMQLSQGFEIPDEVWLAFEEEVNTKLAELNLPKIKIDLETSSVTKMADEVKDVATKWGYVSQAVSSVGSALQSVEDPSAKIAGIVATAVASTALGFAQATTADSKFGTLAWIAASAAGLANMASMIASIKSVTAEYHAEGGIVGMGPFISKGTDTVPAMLTPGEEVLPMSDPRHIRNMRNMIGGAGMQRIVVTGRVHGTDLLIVEDNVNRVRGGSRGAFANIR